ncbi:MAG: hypothetical protein GY927_10555 [bacterium]|nr:hypothetical protein [bacterium]
MNQPENTQVSWPEYRSIEVENALGAKALRPGNPHDALAAATKKADTAIEQLSAQFPAWMQGESSRLNKIRVEMVKEGYTAERLDQLFTCAHDIKGQAATYGYPIAGVIGKLLADLIDKTPVGVQIPLPVIDQHVDTIRAIVRQNLKGDGNAQTSNIIEGLRVLNHTTLKRLHASTPAVAAAPAK